jgi:hypothetical protein
MRPEIVRAIRNMRKKKTTKPCAVRKINRILRIYIAFCFGIAPVAAVSCGCRCEGRRRPMTTTTMLRVGGGERQRYLMCASFI